MLDLAAHVGRVLQGYMTCTTGLQHAQLGLYLGNLEVSCCLKQLLNTNPNLNLQPDLQQIGHPKVY